MKPFFGPAGNSLSFFAGGHKALDEVPAFVAGMGLDAYEFQGGHGIRITQERARSFGEKAREAGVRLSVHAPYYISLSGTDTEKRLKSVDYILQSARAAKWMGAQRIVVHAGSSAGRPRGEALGLAKDTLGRALQALDDEGLSDIRICPETMGKLNQLGTVEEIAELCGLDERLIPCVDFGHVYARTLGGIRGAADYEAILDVLSNRLGEERIKSFHSHFSKIAYTEKGGEKCHLTFEDTSFGPEFEPLAQVLAGRGCAPVLICESAGTQAEDACEMKRIYEKTVEGE